MEKTQGIAELEARKLQHDSTELLTRAIQPALWPGPPSLRRFTLIVLIDYTPLRNRILGTAPMPHGVWLFVIPFAIGMLILEEPRKWLAARTLPGSVDRSPALLRPPRLADPRSSKARKAP